MKTWICLFLGAASLASAEPIKLGYSHSYESVKLIGWKGGIAIIETEAGIVKVPSGDLSDAARKALGLPNSEVADKDAAADAKAAAVILREDRAAFLANAPARNAAEAQVVAKLQAERQNLRGIFTVTKIVKGGVLVSGFCQDGNGDELLYRFNIAMITGVNAAREGDKFNALVSDDGLCIVKMPDGLSRTARKLAFVKAIFE